MQISDQLVIRRVGGMLPTLRPSRNHVWQDIPVDQQKLILALLKEQASLKPAPYPDATSYEFELSLQGKVQTASCGFSAIAKELQSLLPGAAPTISPARKK